MEHLAPARRRRRMRMIRRTIALVAVLALAGVLAACGGSSGSPAASPAASSAASPATSFTIVDSPAAAAKAVAARTPMFAGIGPKDPNLIGQSAWYEATPKEAAKPPVAWSVVFRVGWGDCPSGCIDWHVWTYDLGVDGTVTLVSETGPEPPPAVVEGLRAGSKVTGVAGHVTAGPVCPVVQPGATNCDDRAVNGAVLVITGAGGREVARVTTDAAGQFFTGLQPGDYTLVPQPTEGLMGTPAAMPFTVTDGSETFLDVSYDTGIR